MLVERPVLVPLLLVVTLAVTGCSTAGSSAEVDVPATASSASRSVETVFGPVEVPEDPQRIVVVQSRALDMTLALGLDTIASTHWSAVEAVPAYLADEVPADFVVVGNDDEPDFEAIAALEPDLIIGDEGIEPNLATFQDIAPVAAYASEDAQGRFDWRTQLAAIAEFTGRQSEAEDVLADFDSLVTGLDADVSVRGQSVIPLRVRADEVRWYLPSSFAGSYVLSSMTHVTLPEPEVPSENGDWSVIPAERLDTLQADRIIAFVDSEEAYRSLQAQSLWRELPVVRNDGVCVTENLDAWVLGGPSAAEVVAADVRACLVD